MQRKDKKKEFSFYKKNNSIEISYRSLVIVKPMSCTGIISIISVIVIAPVGPIGWVQGLHTQRSQKVVQGRLQCYPGVGSVEHFGCLEQE
jgi:hypothetical protein